jgi:hypothetical protein
MIKPELANLYRRFTRRQPVTTALPQVDALLALAEGEHGTDTERMLTDVGRSGVHADLLRFARDLAPESARLGVQLEQAFEASLPGHRRAQRTARPVAPQRSWLRLGSAIAASLLVAVAVWSLQRSHTGAPPVVAAAAVDPALPDRIFASLGSELRPANQKHDAIFRADFNRDKIFKTQFSDG